MTSPTTSHDGLTAGFVQRVLFVILAIGLAILAYKLLGLWLIVFGAVVVAVVLRFIAEPLMTYAKLPPPLAVLAAMLIVIGLFATTLYLFGATIVDQVATLTATLPAAWADLQTRMEGWGIGEEVKKQLDALGHQAGGMAAKIPEYAGNVVSILANVLVAGVGGVILAISPGKYRNGIVFLFPDAHKARVRHAMNVAGQALEKWFIGQFISMVVVGVMVGVGLSLLGVPSAVALGMMSGLAQFVPVVGPVVAAGPGLLLAAMAGTDKLIWAMAVYMAVSQLESNVITPMVQRRVASVPMVLTLFAMVGFAGLLGPVGILFAMPLTVVSYTLVMRFYKPDDTGKPDDEPAPPARKPTRRKASN